MPCGPAAGTLHTPQRHGNTLVASNILDPAPRAWVFDAYGTLLDVASAVRDTDVPAGKATLLAETWRAKQLQYTWLRSIQGEYADFERVTRDALAFALQAVGLHDPGLMATLVERFRSLEVFKDAAPVLKELHQRGIPCWILSNGTNDMLDAALADAGLMAWLSGILSADAVRVYKPHAHVYQLAVDRLKLPAPQIGFVSANGWDAFGAARFGMSVVWCNRSGAPPEQLPGTPARTVRSLAELPLLLAR